MLRRWVVQLYLLFVRSRSMRTTQVTCTVAVVCGAPASVGSFTAAWPASLRTAQDCRRNQSTADRADPGQTRSASSQRVRVRSGGATRWAGRLTEAGP